MLSEVSEPEIVPEPPELTRGREYARLFRCNETTVGERKIETGMKSNAMDGHFHSRVQEDLPIPALVPAVSLVYNESGAIFYPIRCNPAEIVWFSFLIYDNVWSRIFNERKQRFGRTPWSGVACDYFRAVGGGESRTLLGIGKLAQLASKSP